MRNVIIAILTLSGIHFHTQGVDIPRSSPKASVSQTIGVDVVTINYSRPSARDRKVFGELVPFGKVWRAGANEATVISFNYEITFGDKLIPAGKYGFFMIPGKDKWVVILNGEWDQWGAYHYDEKKDIVRIEVKPKSVSMTESCTFNFTDVSKTVGTLNMDWETTRIAIPLSTETHEHTLMEIEKATADSRDNWYIYSAAAQYHFYERKDASKSIEYIDIAIALDAPNPAPWMLKSQILAYQEKYKEAIEQANKALEVSERLNFWFEIEENEKKIKEWKEQLN